MYCRDCKFRGMSEIILPRAPGLPVTLAWAGWLHTDLCFCWLWCRDMMLHGRMIAPARRTNAQCVSSPSTVCLGLWHHFPTDSKHWVDQQGMAPSPGFLNIESEVGQRWTAYSHDLHGVIHTNEHRTHHNSSYIISCVFTYVYLSQGPEDDCLPTDSTL